MEETAVERAKRAIEDGNLRDVEMALENKYIRAKDRVGREGFTLIHWACFYGNLEVQAARNELFLLTISLTDPAEVAPTRR